MGIISPVMKFVVEEEEGFPAPSEQEKVNKAIERYRKILRSYPERADIGEIKFGLADLYVGRGEEGDYEKAAILYEDILKSSGSLYLRARAYVGKAELLVPGIKKEQIEQAIELCRTARKTLKNDLSDFFAAKSFVVEADLRMVRDGKGDHDEAMKIHEKLIKDKNTHWYFKNRAMIGKAELILYHFEKKLSEAVTLCERVVRSLKDRAGDYFYQKTKVLEAEIRIRRARGEKDFESAEKLLKEVITYKGAYKDLKARAQLDLAEISKNPQARKYLNEVEQTEGLDPYLVDKARQLSKKLK